MADAWFCMISGAEIGPLSAQELKAIATAGRLAPEDVVRLGSDGAWVPASRVKGLFSATASAGSSAAAGSSSDARPRRVLKAKPVADPISEKPAPGGRGGSPPPPPPSRQPLVVTPTDDLAAPPKARAKASGGEFDFLEEAYASPAARLDVTSPAASATKEAMEKKRQEQKKKQFIFVMVLAGLLVILAILMVVLFLKTQGKKDTPAAKPATEAKTEAGDEKGDEKKELGEKGSGDKRDAKKETGKETTGKVKEHAEGKWNDASKPVTIGNVSLRISSEIGRPKATVGEKVVPHKDEFLLVRVELTNKSDTRKLEYTSWNTRLPAVAGVKLEDDFGNEYALKSFASGPSADGQLKTESIYPSKSIEDLLIFEKPIEKAKSLKLQLPAAAFKEKETVKLQIEMKTVGKAKPDAPSAKPEAKAPSPFAPKPTPGPSPFSFQPPKPVPAAAPLGPLPSNPIADPAAAAPAVAKRDPEDPPPLEISPAIKGDKSGKIGPMDLIPDPEPTPVKP